MLAVYWVTVASSVHAMCYRDRPVRPAKAAAARAWSGAVAGWLLAALVGLSASAQTTVSAAPWPTQQWARSTPEQQGMDSSVLLSLLEFGAVSGMDSIVVTRHGTLVAEAYYAPYQRTMRHTLNSATKGVLGMLVAMAVQQGRIHDTDQSMLAFFTDRTVANLDDRKKSITVQQLLDMTSGLEWIEPLDGSPQSSNAMSASGDWVQYVLDRPMARMPGSGFNYNGGGSHVLSAILSKQTGMSAEDYARQNLFAPLGITDLRWRKDPQGVSTGGFGLYLQTRDMAKIGYLVARGGMWDGKRLLPQAWIDRITRASVPMNLSPSTDWRYGEQWWTVPARKAYLAVGFNRQLILVMPETDVVVALTGHANYPFEPMLARVAQAVQSDAPLPPNPAALALLERKSAEVATEPGASEVTSSIAPSVSGKTYRMARNTLGIRDFTLSLVGSASVDFTSLNARTNETRTLNLPLGKDGRFATGTALDGPAVVGKAAWTAPDTLVITARWVVDGEAARYVLRFSGNKVVLQFSNNYGVRLEIAGEADN